MALPRLWVSLCAPCPRLFQILEALLQVLHVLLGMCQAPCRLGTGESGLVVG